MRDKIYQLTSSCLGPKLGKNYPSFLDFNFYPATAGGRASAVANVELYTTALDLKVGQQDVAFKSRIQLPSRRKRSLLESNLSGVLADDAAVVIRYPRQSIASFVEYFTLAFSTIMTVNFALLCHKKDPPSLVLAFLRDESPVLRRFYLQCAPEDTRELDWATHHPLFCIVLDYLCTTWVKAFYHDNFGEAIGAKKGDTVRRSLLFAHEGVKATKRIRVLEAEVAAIKSAASASGTNCISSSAVAESSSSSNTDSSEIVDHYEEIVDYSLVEQEIMDTIEDDYYEQMFHDSLNGEDASLLQENTLIDDNAM